MIALGALGNHGHHVQGHVVGAHRDVGESKIQYHKMVEQNVQDPQMLPDHATRVAAQVSKISLLGWGKHPIKLKDIQVGRLENKGQTLPPMPTQMR